MDLANLAVVFAPNLFPSEHCSKLDGEAEELLQTQAAVVEQLIAHASEIGTVPQSLLEKVQAAFLDTEHKRQSPPGPEDGRGGEAESRRKRWRRRSVGNIVTEALSKFKSGRALRAAPCPETKEGVCRGNESLNNSTLRTSFNSKRKASDDATWTSELSVKKRRSALNSDSSNEEASKQPADADPVQGPTSHALVFSNSPSHPVSGTGSRSGSPRISTAKVQGRRSSGRKHPQRKHSIRNAPSCSPTPFERNDVGRKSLRFFFQGSKGQHLPSPSIQVTEPSSWLLTKKMAAEVQEGPDSQQQWACSPSRKPKETGERSLGQSTDEDFPPQVDQVTPDTAVKHTNGTGASPGLDGVSCGHREPASETAEDSLGDPTEAAPPLRPLHVLRRSLSWPEGLSMRDTTQQGKLDSSPDKAAIVPRDRFGLAEPEQPGAEVTAAGMRQAGAPAVCVMLAESDRAARPQNEPRDIRPSQLDLPDDRSARADGFRRFSKVPPCSLKHFTLNFQRTSSQPNEGPNEARPKRKGGRRFGRSLSYESSLPLRAEEEAGCTAKRKGSTLLSPKSPLQSFKAYGRQIFIAHKHWAMAFAALRGRKESASPSPQETERAAADSQEPLLGCQPEEERHRYRRSPKFPSVEPQLVAGQDPLDL